MAGEPLADAAISYLLMMTRGCAPFARLYRTVYVEKAQTTEEAFDHWIPLAAAYLMTTANQAQRIALFPYVKSTDNKGV